MSGQIFTIRKDGLPIKNPYCNKKESSVCGIGFPVSKYMNVIYSSSQKEIYATTSDCIIQKTARNASVGARVNECRSKTPENLI